MIRPLLFALALIAAPAANAALAPKDLGEVALAPAAGARLPLDAKVAEDGHETTLGRVLARHPASVFLFADYTCASVCGAELAIAAASLADPKLADLRAGLVVVGLDPKDGPDAARRMRDAALGEQAAGASFLTAEQATVDTLTEAGGYHYRYDPATDQFAHPAAVLAVAEDGRIGRALAGLSLMPATLRPALVEAGEGRVGGLVERVVLRCYGFDPATGLYTADAKLWLRLAGGLTVLSLCLAILALSRRSRTT
ncbi:SCO family protein [Aureimonas leprariae]|uniref:SCO family protein n=1 Tax=Plantimonas leprariae TaxID=2615207 RepID=A0A7V7PTI1_9HYPH|nr:SCO family protein [Aureimonas leprariae]KAB0682972.1 SCO family protein [Aureimonas leprariae]